MADFDQPEVFQAAASSIFVPLQLTITADRPFRAQVTHVSLGGVLVARIASTPGQVGRQPWLIGSADRELVKVTLGQRGHLAVAQDDQRTRVGPGDLVAYETIRPYTLTSGDDTDQIVLAVPRQMLGPSADAISRRTALVLRGAAGIQPVVTAFFRRPGRPRQPAEQPRCALPC